MPTPAHRYKTYTGETGVTYRYFFASRRRVKRPEGQGAGSDLTFVVVADQSPPYTVKVFVSDRAVDCWRLAHGRELDTNEQYASAKMCLFRAFDTLERLVDERMNLVVDETNVEELLEPLGL